MAELIEIKYQDVPDSFNIVKLISTCIEQVKEEDLFRDLYVILAPNLIFDYRKAVSSGNVNIAMPLNYMGYEIMFCEEFEPGEIQISYIDEKGFPIYLVKSTYKRE